MPALSGHALVQTALREAVTVPTVLKRKPVAVSDLLEAQSQDRLGTSQPGPVLRCALGAPELTPSPDPAPRAPSWDPCHLGWP